MPAKLSQRILEASRAQTVEVAMDAGADEHERCGKQQQLEPASPARSANMYPAQALRSGGRRRQRL
jgi:hypothetical protein